jgi:hypothetical protein
MERVALTPEQTRATVHGDASDPRAHAACRRLLDRGALSADSPAIEPAAEGSHWRAAERQLGGPNVHPVRSR